MLVLVLATGASVSPTASWPVPGGILNPTRKSDFRDPGFGFWSRSTSEYTKAVDEKFVF